MLASAIFLLFVVIRDQSRLQPYVYMYLVTLIVLGASAADDPDTCTDSLCIMTAAAYVWSGAQKLNPIFFDFTFPVFISPALALVGISALRWKAELYYLGIAAAVFALIIGLLLLTLPRKTVPIVMAAIMLAVVLVCLGPLGRLHNKIVWPWNVWLFITVLLAHGNNRKINWSVTLGSFRASHLIKLAVVVLFGIMPFLGLLKRWDGYMSFALYSGNTGSHRCGRPSQAAAGNSAIRQ